MPDVIHTIVLVMETRRNRQILRDLTALLQKEWHISFTDACILMWLMAFSWDALKLRLTTGSALAWAHIFQSSITRKDNMEKEKLHIFISLFTPFLYDKSCNSQMFLLVFLWIPRGFLWIWDLATKQWLMLLDRFVHMHPKVDSRGQQYPQQPPPLVCKINSFEGYVVRLGKNDVHSV